MTDKQNTLYFFSDRFYTMPGDNYSFGIVAAKDTAEAKLMLGTEMVDGLPVGKTDATGQILCAETIRNIDPRTDTVTKKVTAELWKLNDGVDVTARVQYLRDTISKMQGIDCSNLEVDFTRCLRIPGGCTSTGKDLWRVMVKHPDFPNTVPIMLSAEGDGSITGDDDVNFTRLGETEEYSYNESVDRVLTPEWLMLDLLEQHGLTPEDWYVIAGTARAAAYSATPVDGWEEVDEVYGQNESAHVIRFWLNPDWQNLIVAAVAKVVESMPKEPLPENLAEELAGSESADEAAE
ncbi:hypothetical protein pEaSNUABM6_00246 [Erwinia phage pEa_SNUABM_6]|nr:hypothetical protein pEaSNUABM6_00246 [Erwinia phage pEa_SNUABM_6]